MHESLPTRLAFTDLETTGQYPGAGEIIEIGLIVADTATLQVLDRLSVKVKPEHIETASPEAMRVNGYRAEDWHDAVSLKEGLRLYVEKARGAMFCAWRVAFDFSFIQSALYEQGMLPQEHITSHLCIYTMALYALRHERITPFRSKQVAQFLNLQPEPEPHRAIHGAEQAFDIYKKLITR